MNSKPTDAFLNTDQEGHLSKTDEGFKKDDELVRHDPSKASKFVPMEHKVEKLDDGGDILIDALNLIAERPSPEGKV